MNERILVVEDNRQNLELVEFLLEEAGFVVVSAVDAPQVMARLEEEIPDLVLMDMQLPGTDGLDLVGQLRRREELARVPIVALTAHALRGDRERFLEGGCDGYISKPIDVGSFADTVRGHLSGRGEGPRGES